MVELLVFWCDSVGCNRFWPGNVASAVTRCIGLVPGTELCHGLVLYLILGAPFIALAQISVYAGAIMHLVLFVIMLLGTEKLPAAEPLRAHRPLALFGGPHLPG